MKKSFFVLFTFVFLCLSAQFPSDFKFDKNIIEAENHWVCIPSMKAKKGIQKFYYGFLYFDESGGGYSIQKINSFTIKGDKLIPLEKNETYDIIQRIGNIKINFSFFTEQREKELNLTKSVELIKNYNFIKDKNIALLERSSNLNGMGGATLALPILLKIKPNLPKNKKLYFELAFAYNALGEFSKADNIIAEAESLQLIDELLIKEKIFSLVNMNKIKEAEKYLETNFSKIKSKLYKAENIINIINYLYKNKDYKSVRKWIKFYEDKGIDGKYSKYIDFYKDKLKKE